MKRLSLLDTRCDRKVNLIKECDMGSKENASSRLDFGRTFSSSDSCWERS